MHIYYIYVTCMYAGHDGVCIIYISLGIKAIYVSLYIDK